MKFFFDPQYRILRTDRVVAVAGACLLLLIIFFAWGCPRYYVYRAHYEAQAIAILEGLCLCPESATSSSSTTPDYPKASDCSVVPTPEQSLDPETPSDSTEKATSGPK